MAEEGRAEVEARTIIVTHINLFTVLIVPTNNNKLHQPCQPRRRPTIAHNYDLYVYGQRSDKCNGSADADRFYMWLIGVG